MSCQTVSLIIRLAILKGIDAVKKVIILFKYLHTHKLIEKIHNLPRTEHY